jgi:uncharacterized protein (TIGR02246 family)
VEEGSWKQKSNAIIDAQQESWNRHDTDAFLGLSTDDADFVNVLGLHRHGKEELRTEFTFLHSTMMRNSRARMLDRSVRLLAPGVAIAHSNWDMVGVESAPGWNVPDVRRGVPSYVMVERDGAWRIRALTTRRLRRCPPDLSRETHPSRSDRKAPVRTSASRRAFLVM